MNKVDKVETIVLSVTLCMIGLAVGIACLAGSAYTVLFVVQSISSVSCQ